VVIIMSNVSWLLSLAVFRQATNTSLQALANPSSGHTSFGSDADFTLLLVAVAVFTISLHLMTMTTQMHTWYFSGDKSAPSSEIGWFASVVAGMCIMALCIFHAFVRSEGGNVLTWITMFPKDFALGLLASSLVPSSVSMAKTIGLFGTAQLSPVVESRGTKLSMAFGAALVAFVNLLASTITIFLVAWPALRSFTAGP
jgi:hypothetical protein